MEKTLNEVEKPDLFTKEDLEIFLDNLPVSSWIKDLDGKYIYANKAYASLLNVNKEDIIGKFHKDFWSKELCNCFDKLDKEVIKTKNSIFLEECTKSDNDNFEWFETYKTPLLDKDGNVKYTGGILNETTLNKKLNVEIAKSYDELSDLDSIIINNKNQEYTLFNNIKMDIVRYLKCDGISICIYNKETSFLVPAFNMGISQDILDALATIKISQENLLETLNSDIFNKIRHINEGINLINIKNLVNSNVTYMGTYNIMFNDEFLGILNICYKKDNPPRFEKDSFIKTMCNQIGILIKNNYLSKELTTEFEKCREAEKELEAFLETAVDLLAIIDDSGAFHKINSGWTTLSGWSEEELLSMNLIDVICKDDLNHSLEFIKDKKDYPCMNQLVNRVTCKNGDLRWIEWSFKYVSKRNIFITTGRDITERKNIEAKQRKYEDALHLESIKNEFFANVSHEFKTPLNIILATMQLMNNNVKDKNIQSYNGVNINKYINSIKQNSYRLLRLVNNLIDMSRIDTGYYEIHLENHNIVNIVEDITISVANYVEDKGIELIFDTDIEEKIIACDCDKIERIMLNLLSNAIKYTYENGLINVNLNIINDTVVVSVKDNGIGIPMENLNLVFERFRQVDNILTRRCEGSGIGLSLVKSLVEMHDGSIEVKSEVGKGSEFTFKLPIRTAENMDSSVTSKGIDNSKIEKCNLEFSDIYDL
ncbi:ATP-binding protein [Clostridium sp.]|uniref:ATP-binding protein n=1 Tax=Clostridium sp. TaxID=1506 RepID=UPI00321706FE